DRFRSRTRQLTKRLASEKQMQQFLVARKRQNYRTVASRNIYRAVGRQNKFFALIDSAVSVIDFRVRKDHNTRRVWRLLVNDIKIAVLVGPYRKTKPIASTNISLW